MQPTRATIIIPRSVSSGYYPHTSQDVLVNFAAETAEPVPFIKLSVFRGDGSPKPSVSIAGNAKSLTRHIIRFATVAQNEEQTKRNTTERALHTPLTPPSPHLQLDCSWGAGSFTQVWQKQADKLNWSEALNGMPNCWGRESAAMKCNGNGSGS